MILDELAAAARERTRKDQQKISREEMKEKALALPELDFPFEKALSQEGMRFICEMKKASPSKGIIEPDFRPLDLLEEYEKAGADAISILTEPQWFLGSDAILKEVALKTELPILRKDFVVDPYMIYQARVLGASAVLLIVALLSEEELKEDLEIAQSLGMSALVEVHDERELEKALKAKARLIGVNNRNLKDFSMNMDNTGRIARKLDGSVLLVSESGMKDAKDVKRAEKAGAKAVLIGESLMRAADKSQKLAELRNYKEA